MRNALLIWPVAAVVIYCGSGCRERPAQVAVKQQTLQRLTGLLRFYDIDFPGVRPTNFSQVFLDLQRPYPHGIDSQFRAFGAHAGFTNSFYEKYIFLPPGLSHRMIEGEILLLNAQPFPDRDGKLGRMVLSKLGAGHASYRINWILEPRIQQIFQEAGIKVPKPPLMLPPPPEPPPVDDAFRNAAAKGLHEAMSEYERRYPTPLWRRPQWQLIGVAFFLAGAGATWWWFRRRRD